MYAHRVNLAFLAPALALVFQSAPTFAAWQPDGIPIAVVAGAQSYPLAISDGAGGAMIVWADTRNGTSNSDIFAQRIDAFGAVQWSANGVGVCTAAGGQSAPEIIPDGAGGAIIVWMLQGGDHDLYAQRINPAGGVQWAPNGVPLCTAIEEQVSPMIASDGAGGVIAAWYDWRNTNYDIFAQRIDAGGAVQWTTDGVPICTASFDQYGPTIISDGTGGAIIAWYDHRGANADLYAQRVDASGAVQWTPDGVAFCTAANNQYAPLIVSDGAGGGIAVWIDWRNGTSDVFAQRVDGSGAAQWTEDGVALCIASGEQFYPTIVADGAGGACVSWWDRRGPNADIYAQRVSGSGATQWTSDGAPLSTAPNDQVYPRITSDGTGGAIVTWFDYRTGTGDIYAQRVTSSGTIDWTPNGLAVCTATNHQTYSSIAASGAGGAIVTWQDWRSNVLSDVFAQRVGTAPTGAGTTPSAAFTVLQNHPNPFSGTTELRIELSAESDVSIAVYDVAGRPLRSESLGLMSAGTKTIGFNGRDDTGKALPSGVYFYRITAKGTTVTKKMVIAR